MTEFPALILLALAALAAGLIAIFAGRRYYALWLGLAVYFFSARVLDLALIRYPDGVRNWGGLFIAILVVAVVVRLRDRVIRYVPSLGGFIVGALMAERLLGFIHPEAGKYLYFAVLLAGGLIGPFLFQRWLDFDNALIVLSALWGAAFISKAIFDVVDVFQISAAGSAGPDDSLGNFLNITLLLQTLFWLGLAAAGIVVQRRLGYPPIPAPAGKPAITLAQDLTPAPRPRRVAGRLVGGIFAVLLLAVVIGGNNQLSRSIHASLRNLERSLGLEAEAPGDAPWEWAATLLRPRIELQPDDRILVLAPHPDDDILSAAGVIQQALEMGLPVRVVFFTNGDYNEASFALYRKEISLSPIQALRLGETRRREALAAERILGVKPEQIEFLGYPDGGGLKIFENHWGQSLPYRAPLSGKTAVFYTFAHSFAAPFKGENIVADIEQVLSDFGPTKVFTSHPGDMHPDHQTLPLYLQIALWNLGGELAPEIYHFISHYGRWPQPRGYQPERPLEPPAQYDAGDRWRILPLTTEQNQKKLQALQAHKTQWGSGQAYLQSLVRANELFDVSDVIALPPGQEVQALPAESILDEEAVYLYPDSLQNAFNDADLRMVKLEGDDLVIALETEEPLAGNVHARVWAMGYRSDTPFEKMPKIFVDLGAERYQVLDRGKRMAANSVTLSGAETQRQLRLPLSLLGSPERILLSVQTNAGGVPLDAIPWLFLAVGNE